MKNNKKDAKSLSNSSESNISGSDSSVDEDQEFIQELEHPQILAQKHKLLQQEEADRELDKTELNFVQYLKKRKEEKLREVNIDDIKLTDGNLDNAENLKLYNQQMQVKHDPELTEQAKRKRLIYLANESNQMNVNLIIQKEKQRKKPKFENIREQKFEQKMKIFKNLDTFLETKGFLKNLNDLNEEQKTQLQTSYKRIKMNQVFEHNQSSMDIFLKQESLSQTQLKGGFTIDYNEYDESMFAHLDLLEKCNQLTNESNIHRDSNEVKVLKQFVNLVQTSGVEELAGPSGEYIENDSQNSNPFFTNLNKVLFPKIFSPRLSQYEEEIKEEKKQQQEAAEKSKAQKRKGRIFDAIQNQEINKLQELIESEKHQFNHENLDDSFTRVNKKKNQQKYHEFQKKARKILNVLSKTSQNIYNQNILQVASTQQFMKVAESVRKKENMDNKQYLSKLEVIKNLEKYAKSDKRLEALEMYRKYRLLAMDPEEIMAQSSLVVPVSPTKSKWSSADLKNLNISSPRLTSINDLSIIKQQFPARSDLNQQGSLSNIQQSTEYDDEKQKSKVKLKLKVPTINSLKNEQIESEVLTFITSKNPSSFDLLYYLSDTQNQNIQDYFVENLQNQETVNDYHQQKKSQSILNEENSQEKDKPHTKPYFSIQKQMVQTDQGTPDSQYQSYTQHQYTIEVQKNEKNYFNFQDTDIQSHSQNSDLKLPSITERLSPVLSKSKSVSHSLDINKTDLTTDASIIHSSNKSYGQPESQYFLGTKINTSKKELRLTSQTDSNQSNRSNLKLNHSNIQTHSEKPELSSRNQSDHNGFFLTTPVDENQSTQFSKKPSILTVTQGENLPTSPLTQHRGAIFIQSTNIIQLHNQELGSIIEDISEQKKIFKTDKKQFISEINSIENKYQKAYNLLHKEDHVSSLRMLSNSNDTLDRYQRTRVIDQRAIQLVM